MKSIRRKVTMAVAVPAALALTLGVPAMAFAGTPSHNADTSVNGGVSINSDHHGHYGSGLGLNLGIVLGLDLGFHGGSWHGSHYWGSGLLGL